LTPAKQQRGLSADAIRLELEDPRISDLVARVRSAGGVAIGCYCEPFSGKPLLLATVPRTAVEPTPFQRNLSPIHAKRLAQKITETGMFLDPLIVVNGADGGLWTPNGRHRLAAAKVLGLQQITVLISPDADLAFKILALNTEKAHNLRDRSLEVIRMARELATRRKRSGERDYVLEFEEASLLTLGIAYEEAGRFAGSAYHPILRKVDRWSAKSLPVSLRERAGWAARLLGIEADVAQIIDALKQRGFRSPYLKGYVVARINPVRFHRAKKGDDEPPMAVGAALTRMTRSLKNFDVAGVRQQDLALVAALTGDPE
jgi:ParB family chromosome partitioning protein